MRGFIVKPIYLVKACLHTLEKICSQISGHGPYIPIILSVSNDGQLVLNLEQEGVPMQSTFQVAGITRPLMSVGRVCDQGLRCLLDDKEALVVNKQDGVVCRFERRGGLYVAKLKLKSPRPAQ